MLGEWLRRLALGLVAALLTARAYFPSEPDLKAEGGPGLTWALAVLVAAGVAIASALVGGTLRLRWSWADAGVLAMTALVGAGACLAADRRTAINLAWQWGAVGFAYLLVRNLPRGAAESRALAGALVATAVAVSVYGLYQAGVELKEVRDLYRANPERALRLLGIAPDGPAKQLFENRLFHSNEVWSTFALANSLAGFLVGPLVLVLDSAWRNLLDRAAKPSRRLALAMAAPPGLAVLVCLVLTKSRSAYIGLAVALAVLAWRERRRVRTRTLLVAAAAGSALLAALVAGALATGHLDLLVLTESTKSLRYRGEYWLGAWRVITRQPGVFWRGLGPGNFGWAYVRYKAPQASEEVADPHNLLLEVWTSGGILAALGLLAALGFGLRELLGPSTKPVAAPVDDPDDSPSAARDPAGPRSGAGWLVAASGAGWLLVILLGELNPFAGDLFARWLILGGSWAWAVMFGQLLWRRVPIGAPAFGAAALAVTVNLLAAGGIGIPAVSATLWTLIALGLNLREDRPCGRLRAAGGLAPAFGLAAVFAALAGTFYGSVTPFWRSERAIAEAQAFLARKRPDYAGARAAFLRAADPSQGGDRYSARPWLGLAYMEYHAWKEAGAAPENKMWRAVPISLLKASSRPRNPHNWSLHRDEALITREILAQIGSRLAPKELIRFHADIARAARLATREYPNNAVLHALLAEASADLGMLDEAASEAEEALRLDDLMPHAERKLPPAVRRRLETELPAWRAALRTPKPPGG